MTDYIEMNLLSSNPLIQYGKYLGIFSDYSRKLFKFNWKDGTDYLRILPKI